MTIYTGIINMSNKLTQKHLLKLLAKYKKLKLEVSEQTICYKTRVIRKHRVLTNNNCKYRVNGVGFWSKYRTSCFVRANQSTEQMIKEMYKYDSSSVMIEVITSVYYGKDKIWPDKGKKKN